ncbi:cellulose synthase/poly-beta-1,6-N-acetylglucosamine synthase-like glycosyltransferase [Mycolicibacterium sp. BK556]|uniref:glycosyltransferase family 2 protein n=1 Tax=unclassified Mycolicibacterium TaxID=2636767 RepID=UPI0017EFDD2A|nr:MULTISPECIES: glycosyltransferase [unclassified Mycolicibacterium]MBB3604203.1 cellulose synthase/poly-beta-1,6-N-acetylglucosamine synthase-like glycosyltransferase [Mycolicibacterium sp. BK556]MBB3635084.1 cellulose synthase/poly-beta-1,6-N-acetylglucosamine synthase-like glycosyltransferase [Mycolicibacterium sp. BK607]
MTDSLTPALTRASSRLARPGTPAVSIGIHVLVFALWVTLFLLAFGRGGVLAWSVGLAYLGYDAALQVFTGWQIRTLGRSAPPADVVTDRLTLAVIVAAHNEATVLPHTLAALLSQTDPPDEILIADDGSTDATAEMLCRDYGFAVPPVGQIRVGSTALRWVRLPHGGKSAALNAALLRTDADIIVTVDADTVPDRGAISAVRQAFSREPELVATTGVITPHCPPTALGRAMQWFQTYEYIRNFLGRYAWMRVGCLQLISGAFAGFRRDAVTDVGGFDDACLVEDYELVARMRRFAGERGLDWRFRVLGDAQARTEAPASVPAFLRQRRRWFGGFLQTHWWYRGMVGDPRFGRLGTVMLPVKAIDTVAPLYGLTAFGLLIYFLATRNLAVLAPVLVVIIGKLVIDMAFGVWALRHYRRWVGDAGRASLPAAAAALVIEPVTFTLLLHTGAVLGWTAFLGGAHRWGPQRRG